MSFRKRQRYIIVSRFPPPLGGASVFAQRKAVDLTNKGYSVNVVDFGKPMWWFRLLRWVLFSRNTQFIINTLNPFILLLMYVLRSLGRSHLYDHNASRFYIGSTIKRKLLAFFAVRAAQIFVVHRRLCCFYKEIGLSPKVESPFLQPDESRCEEIIRSYPYSLLSFIAPSNYYILLNSAWRYVRTSDGIDLYGFKESMELLTTLFDRKLPVRMVFAIGDFKRNDFPRKLFERFSHYQRARILYLLHGQYEIWPLFRYVDLFLRTTATDGESISVLEALHYKCPVVASDVVPRPNGVTTYQYGNFEALVRSVMSNLPEERKLRDSAPVWVDIECASSTTRLPMEDKQ